MSEPLIYSSQEKWHCSLWYAEILPFSSTKLRWGDSQQLTPAHHAQTALVPPQSTFCLLILYCLVLILAVFWDQHGWVFDEGSYFTLHVLLSKKLLLQCKISSVYGIFLPPTPNPLKFNELSFLRLNIVCVWMNIYTYLYIYQSIDTILIQSYINLVLYHFIYIYIYTQSTRYMCVCTYIYIHYIYTIYTYTHTHTYRIIIIICWLSRDFSLTK